MNFLIERIQRIEVIDLNFAINTITIGTLKNYVNRWLSDCNTQSWLQESNIGLFIIILATIIICFVLNTHYIALSFIIIKGLNVELDYFKKNVIVLMYFCMLLFFLTLGLFGYIYLIKLNNIKLIFFLIMW